MACDSGNPIEGEEPTALTMFSATDSATPALHGQAEPRGGAAHAFVRAMEAHGAAQFLGLVPGDLGHGRGHGQHLFLEERDAERPLQDRLQAGLVP